MLAARFDARWGIALDGAGNVYVADTGNHRLQVFGPVTPAPVARAAAGNISTVAGTGTTGFSGDGGPATSALLKDPRGVAVDSSGNLFIADKSNHRIRKVEAVAACGLRRQ